MLQPRKMLQTDKESLPDDESYDLVIGMLLLTDQIDAALKYIDLTLKSGYILSVNVFTECVRNCVNKGRLDTLVSIIERCKKMDQNKALCPPRNLCNYIANVAMEEDSNEGLVVFVLGTAGRTYNAKLLDGSWAILKRALRQKKKAFSTLHEFETIYRNFTKEAEEDLLSPFTSLYPLVMACSKDGFVTLDSVHEMTGSDLGNDSVSVVYYQLENLSQADPPYKSVAALNCIILGCANTWDVDRAYQTFEAIDGAFGLIPNIHSYNALKCAFVKLNMVDTYSPLPTHMHTRTHTANNGRKPSSKHAL
ncbi:hypothetical protein ACSBR1_034509 [Camellia fascicularis]